jgi:hypothetical protein
MPGYLQQMSKTLFHTPDFSDQSAAAKARLERPEYELKGKEAEQKRLQDVAEGVRKEIMLPAELAEKKAKSLKTAAEIKALEAKGAPLTDVRRKLYEAQINRFIAKNKLGEPMQLPEGITDADAGRLFMAAQKGDTTSWRDARLAFDQQKLEFQKGKEATAENRWAIEREEKDLAKGFTFNNESFTGRTEKEAQALRKQIADYDTVKAGLNDLTTDYAKLTLDNIKEFPAVMQSMDTVGSNLVMRIKNLFELGAPQEGELKFLYNFLSANPGNVAKSLLLDATLGTSFPDKLKNIDRIFKQGVQAAIDAKAVSANSRVSPPPTKPSTSAPKPGRKVVTDPNEL